LFPVATVVKKRERWADKKIRMRISFIIRDMLKIDFPPARVF